MPVEIPLFLVPAFANDPPPTPLQIALVTAREQLKKLIKIQEAKATTGWHLNEEGIKVIDASTMELFIALEDALKNLKAYEKKHRGRTKLRKRHIREIAKMANEMLDLIKEDE